MKSLDKKQFQVLEAIAVSDIFPTQRELSRGIGYSLGTINKVIKEFVEAGYISGGKISELGCQALEPYRVKRAVFLAAGVGARMAPITFNTPKPLVRVHGKRIIDTLIDACLAAEIEEIYVVRGYLSEQFDALLKKYPMIHFIENPLYNESENIVSAKAACEHFKNAYVFESDLYLYNPKLIRKYHYATNFLAIRKSRTDDWCFEERSGIITEEKVGGENCWQMVGISYWDEADGIKLVEDIEAVLQSPGGKERFWEQVPLVYRKKNYSVEIRECYDEDVVEIDTYKELKEIDKNYAM